jgi:hypothetical protein
LIAKGVEAEDLLSLQYFLGRILYYWIFLCAFRTNGR